MATFALIHGAGDVGWYWHLVERELRSRGHETVAPDLPCDDDSAGLPEYADAVAEAAAGRGDLVVVAQSFGGFTAPLVAERLPVDRHVEHRQAPRAPQLNLHHTEVRHDGRIVTGADLVFFAQMCLAGGAYDRWLMRLE